ncbi:MAG: methyltransferase, TIGR04325 family, partial [Roseimicrobium sp.]
RRAWTGMEATDAQALIRECRASGIWPRKYGDDLAKMAEVEHQQNIWAVRWLYWHIVLGGLCLRPPHSLIEHKGTDASATNVGADNAGWQNPPLKACPPIPEVWPDPVEHPLCVKLWRKACKDPVKTPPALQALTAAIGRMLPWKNERKVLPHVPVGDVTFTGDYSSWEEATRQCEGYAASAILERVRAAALKIKEGKAVCERDGCLFDKAAHPWPVLAAIYRAAQLLGRPVRILDFGGSLGSLYFQTRHLLGRKTVSEWCVVEQSHFVEAGKQDFEDGVLTFHATGEECLRGGPIDVLLLSAVTHYLPEPHMMIDTMLSWRPCHVVVDRTPFLPMSAIADKIALQTVSAIIYPAKYPIWFFDRGRFLAHFASTYVLVEQFDALDQFHYQGVAITCQGFLFDRNDVVSNKP